MQSIEAKLSQSIIEAKVVTQQINVAPTFWPGVIDAGASTRCTIIRITKTSASGAEFFVNSAGTNYTIDGDFGNLRSSDDLFLTDEAVQFFLNGSILIKGEHIVRTSTYSFIFMFDVDPPDFILILT